MSLWRVGLVGTVASGLTAALAAQIDPVLRAAAAAGGPDQLVTAGCLLVALAIGLWLAGSALVAALALLPGSAGPALARCERHLTPPSVRRLVRLAAGAGVASAVAGTLLSPASATPALALARSEHGVAARWEPSGADTRGSGIPVLDRLAHPSAPPLRPDARPIPATYVVRPGDTLWDIAAAAQPGTPSTSDVAAAWPRWWRLNRSVVGPDPGLIIPGQVLRVPRSPR